MTEFKCVKCGDIVEVECDYVIHYLEADCRICEKLMEFAKKEKEQ
jgi:riboflavin synthase alpha subunit